MRTSNFGAHQRRTALAAGVAALSLLGVGASAAQANFTATLNYQCDLPLVGPVPVVAAVDAAIPPSWGLGKPTDPFQITANATASGQTKTAIGLISATTIEGSTTPNLDTGVAYGALAGANVAYPGGPTNGLQVSVPLTIPQTPVSAKSDVTLVASGTTPPLTFVKTGNAVITVNSLTLNLLARTKDGTPIQLSGTVYDADGNSIDSDGNPNTFDAACTGDPVVLATVVLHTTPPTPPPTTTPTPTPTPTPTATPTPTPTFNQTFTPTPTPTPTDAPMSVAYNYALKGSATLKNLVKGALPLTGSIAAHLQLSTGNFAAQLGLNQTTGNLTALGFLPVVAKVNLVPTEEVTGQLKAGKLTATAKVRIKLPSITTFGLQLAGGASCQATQISTIPLASTQPQFLPLSGGPIAGTFSISNLAGCGALNGIVSPLTAGSGNTILLNLTPTS